MIPTYALQVSPGEPFDLGLAFMLVAFLSVVAWMAVTLRSSVAAFAMVLMSLSMGLYLVDLIAYDFMILTVVFGVMGTGLLAVIAWEVL